MRKIIGLLPQMEGIVFDNKSGVTRTIGMGLNRAVKTPTFYYYGAGKNKVPHITFWRLPYSAMGYNTQVCKHPGIKFIATFQRKTSRCGRN